MRNSAPHFPLFVGRGSVYIFLVSHSANPVQHFIAFVGEASSFALVVKPRRFAICRQIATFPKAEFVAAHSRKGGICCGSQPQTPHCLPIVLSEATSYVVLHKPSPAPLLPQCKTLSVFPDLCLPPRKALLRADGFQ